MRVIERIGPQVSVALGGGAARGVSHIGVLRALIAEGFEIQAVAGTSIGSIIGGAFCAGRLDACEEYLQGLGWRGMLRMLDPVVPRSGLIGGRRLVAVITELLGDLRIEELAVPFCAVAADVGTGAEVRLTAGRLAHAARASSGIPGFFDPYSEALIEGPGASDRWLVDGIVASPVPVGAARQLGDWPIIAVDVNVPFGERVVGVEAPEPVAADGTGERAEASGLRALIGNLTPSLKRSPRGARRPSIVETVYASSMMLQHNFTLAQYREVTPALVLEPNMSGVNMFDFHMAGDLIREGERSTQRALAAARA